MISLIVPVYSSSKLVEAQLSEIALYPQEIKTIFVDDGSPVPLEIPPLPNVSLYRIDVDIPWNNHGARNLGAHVAETEWLLLTDVDHVLPAWCASQLVTKQLSPDRWYAIERRKITPQGTERIHPAPNIFLITKHRFWELGGYDEDYCGSYGSDNVFRRLRGGHYKTLPSEIYLEVRCGFGKQEEHSLSRDTTRAQELFRQKGIVKAETPLRFPWHKVTP